MQDKITSPSDFEDLIDKVRLKLLSQRREVSAHLDTQHDEKRTKVFQNAVRASDEEIDEILLLLLKAKNTLPGFNAKAEELYKRCEGLKEYPKDMQKKLADDLVERQREEVYIITSLSFLFGLPLTVYIAVKNGLLNSFISAEAAAGLGLLVSSSALYHKKVIGAFKAASQSLCQMPEKIRKSPAYTNAREKTVKPGAAIKKVFRDGAKTIGEKIFRGATRKTRAAAKSANDKKPKI
jgi:hypothetical protein